MKIAREVPLNHGELYARLAAKEDEYLTLQTLFNQLIAYRPDEAAALVGEMTALHEQLKVLRARLHTVGKGIAARPIDGAELSLRLGMH